MEITKYMTIILSLCTFAGVHDKGILISSIRYDTSLTKSLLGSTKPGVPAVLDLSWQRSLDSLQKTALRSEGRRAVQASGNRLKSFLGGSVYCEQV